LQCFEYFFWCYKQNRTTNDNNSYYLEQLVYSFMINEHIISIEFGFSSFNATCCFNTKTHFSNEKILLNWNVQNEWYNGKENAR